MKHILTFLFLSLTIEALAQIRIPRSPRNLNGKTGHCQIDCNGKTTTGVDFRRIAVERGDPNRGGPLGRFIVVPDDQGGQRKVETEKFFDELTSLEAFSSGQCGQSLNDDSRDEIHVMGLCPGSITLYENQSLDIKSKHKQNGTIAPNDEQADFFFTRSHTPERERKLVEEMYCRPSKNGSDNSLQNSECKPFDLLIGEENILAVGMKSKACKNISIPTFRPEFSRPLGDRIIQCRKGLPESTTVTTNSDFTLGAWIFGLSIPWIQSETLQISAFNQVPRHVSTNFFNGEQHCLRNISSSQLSYDERCPVSRVSKSKSATFPVGPIPLTVEAGVEGEIGINHFARVGKLWSSSRLAPYAETSGFASAAIDLAIVKTGVEASLLFLRDTYDLFSMANITFQPERRTHPPGFYVSEQLTAKNTIEALSGSINAFIKVPVPKFIGWRWKKFKYTIFDWMGLRTTGTVIDHKLGPKSTMEM